MKFIIRKNNDLVIQDENYYFTLLSNKGSTIFSSLYDLWRRIASDIIDSVYEDLFILGLSVFSVDKRMSRRHSDDNWTRDIEVAIPVLNLDLWNANKSLIQRMLSFLSGDIWSITFYYSSDRYAMQPIRKNRRINFNGFDSVCLFSGGLDSFCGAISLASQGHSMCLLGHNEYPKLRQRQSQIANTIQENYPDQRIEFFDFTANSFAPKNKIGELLGSENSCRSRSLLFLCAAVSIAGVINPETPIYMPENGFISINVPLTQSRSGSCSTRTTHPFFISCFQNLIRQIGLNHKVINPFVFMTKREIIGSVMATNAFQLEYQNTISCSHPSNPRWHKMPYPTNCGYCYPCIIRKVSLMELQQGNDGYTPLPFTNIVELFDYKNDTANDLKAIIASVYRYERASAPEIRRLVSSTGEISQETLNKHVRVYKEAMDDLIVLLNREFGYMGSKNDFN